MAKIYNYDTDTASYQFEFSDRLIILAMAESDFSDG